MKNKKPNTRDRLNRSIVDLRSQLSEDTLEGRIAIFLLDIIERKAFRIEEEELLLAEDLKECINLGQKS